ncbi:MAG: HD domain-containing protein [Hyphomonadaceae bacterium]|nr:HD domain-containing protein [Hyphomonadaceae bacterium]
MTDDDRYEDYLIQEALGDDYPQAGRQRMIMPHPIASVGTGMESLEMPLLAKMSPNAVFMMGDNPRLPRMPAKPHLLDFFRLRFGGITITHLLTSAKRALEQGQDEKTVMAILLHDISNGCFVRADHGYWGAQMIAPYVSDEIAWAVKYHQALRYVADEANGYSYPESYLKFFGHDYVPPNYIRKDAEEARRHRWYMSSRLVTLYDVYFFEKSEPVDPNIFTDIIGRHFKQPEEGLGFDGSAVAHMWRTMIWPNNFL